MAQAVPDEKWDENCLKAGGFPEDGETLYREYQPVGKFDVIATKSNSNERLDSVPVYIVNPKGRDYKNVIIFIYDIFGWNGRARNNYEFADLLCEATGCRIIQPDFFRGTPWPLARFPPSGEEQQNAFGEWWQGIASEKIVVKDIYEKILPTIDGDDHNIGIIGFCWGGLQSVLLGSDNDRFKCIAAIHAAKIDQDKIQGIKVPLYYGPASGDFEASSAQSAMKSKNKSLAKHSVFHSYDTMIHGFCAARGKWNEKEVKDQVDICINETAQFFVKNLK